MMITLRGVAMLCRFSPAPWDADAMPGDARSLRQTEDGLEVGEVANLVLRRGDALGQRLTLRVDPRGVHPDAVRSLDVDVGAVAHEEGARGVGGRRVQRAAEDVRARLAPADRVGHDHRG